MRGGVHPYPFSVNCLVLRKEKRLTVNSLSRHLSAFSSKVLISSMLVVGKWETQRNLEEGYVPHIS